MLNKIFIMGRLTRDPELRRTQSGTAVTSFSLAVDRDYKSQSGEKETDFIDVVAWRATAEFVAKYFTKGRMAVVEGRLQIRAWTDKEGNNRRSAEVVATMSTSATPSATATAHAAAITPAAPAATPRPPGSAPPFGAGPPVLPRSMRRTATCRSDVPPAHVLYKGGTSMAMERENRPARGPASAARSASSAWTSASASITRTLPSCAASSPSAPRSCPAAPPAPAPCISVS